MVNNSTTEKYYRGYSQVATFFSLDEAYKFLSNHILQVEPGMYVHQAAITYLNGLYRVGVVVRNTQPDLFDTIEETF